MTHSSQPLDSPKPVKVLHIGKYFPPYAGGMETYLRDLMAAQAKQGLEPMALVHQSHISIKSQEEFFETGGSRLLITRVAVWIRLLFTPISPTFAWKLAKLIKQERPDVLHFHMPNVSAFWALLSPSARKIPWVVHWHADVLASEYSRGLRLFYKIYRPFERALLKQSDRIIATSLPYLESSDSLKEFRNKCTVVPLGLDTTTLLPTAVMQERTSQDRLIVLAIGRLTYYKGFEYLIRAIAELEGVEAHLVGTGDLEPDLRKLALELKLSKRVTFHGKLPSDALVALFQNCDCVCLPSIERTEAFGMVLLEAMSFGKATVVSNVPGSGMGWIVDNGVTGLHAPPRNAAALADCLGLLRDNRDILRTYGENGRAKFALQFDIEKSAGAVSTTYAQALAIHTHY